MPNLWCSTLILLLNLTATLLYFQCFSSSMFYNSFCCVLFISFLCSSIYNLYSIISILYFSSIFFAYFSLLFSFKTSSLYIVIKSILIPILKPISHSGGLIYWYLSDTTHFLTANQSRKWFRILMCSPCNNIHNYWWFHVGWLPTLLFDHATLYGKCESTT